MKGLYHVRATQLLTRSITTIKASRGFSQLKLLNDRQRSIKRERSKKTIPKTGPTKEIPPILEFKIKCSGCGARFQDSNLSNPGYLSRDDMVSWDSKTPLFCTRCQGLATDTPSKMYSVSEEKFNRILTELSHQKAIAVVVCDVMGFPFTLPPKLDDTYPRNRDIILCINKVDVIAKNAHQMENLKRYYRQLVRVYEKRTLLNFSKVFFVSGRTGYGLSELSAEIQKCLAGTTFPSYDFCYLLGVTNAGKSTIFNKLAPLLNSKVGGRGAVTESHSPGTTVNNIKTEVSPLPPSIKPSSSRHIASQQAKLRALLNSEVQPSGGQGDSLVREWCRSDIDTQLKGDLRQSQLLIDTPGVKHHPKAEKEAIYTCTDDLTTRTVTLSPGDCLVFGWYRLWYVRGLAHMTLTVRTPALDSFNLVENVRGEREVGYSISGDRLSSKIYAVHNHRSSVVPVGDVVLGTLGVVSILPLPGECGMVAVYGPTLPEISYRTPSLALNRSPAPRASQREDIDVS